MVVYTVIRTWQMGDLSDTHLIGVFTNKNSAAEAARVEYNKQTKCDEKIVEVVVIETEVNKIYSADEESKEIWWNGKFWGKS